jgi:hypothetical protein
MEIPVAPYSFPEAWRSSVEAARATRAASRGLRERAQAAVERTRQARKGSRPPTLLVQPRCCYCTEEIPIETGDYVTVREQWGSFPRVLSHIRCRLLYD